MADVKHFSDRNDPALVALLQQGAIGVLRTDTIYGIVTSALDEAAVRRLYKVRHRSAHKRSIILIADHSQLLPGIPKYATETVQHYWPGKVTIELPVDEHVPDWLHRGARETAYRMPADEELRQLLRQTGPLIAPSANLEGQPPAYSIPEAQRYFGDAIDFYVDSGICDPSTPPSRLLRVHTDGTVETLR